MDLNSCLPDQSHRDNGNAGDIASAEPTMMYDAPIAGDGQNPTKIEIDVDFADPQTEHSYLLQQQIAQEQINLGELQYSAPAGEEVS